MKLRSTDQVAAEKQHMFNCAELLLEMFFFNQEHNVDYFLQSQPLFPARRQIEAGMCS